jgi:hypothetical protein
MAATAPVSAAAARLEPRPSVLARFAGEALVVAGFVALTLLMTWPWVTHLRDAVSDAGDPYLSSWILSWDFHQTFHDPLHLFDANLFYPYRYSLAFSENEYGLALLFFPLFALGLRPLTVHGLAILLGFALSGYGAFRLSRTLTGSVAAAWIAGIAFAFVPYRFLHITHVNYLFAGWIPIALEALVLYLRSPTARRAVWLGVAFYANALTCLHWFVLTLLPLGATFVLLLFRYGLKRDRRVIGRAALAVGAALLALLPFLLPYRRVAKLYGFVRTEDESRYYSAHLESWVTPEPHNRLWRSLAPGPPSEQTLFPGLALVFLPLAAFLLVKQEERDPRVEALAPRPRWLPLLDAAALACAAVALLASTPFGLTLRLSGRTLLQAREPTRALGVLAALLLVRWFIAYPRAFTFLKERSLARSLERGSRPEVLAVASLWVLFGFLGSFGPNGPFHRVLFELVFLFRSIRVPARWAMICDLGLSVLAGYGALLLAQAARARFPRWKAAGSATLAAIALAVLFEDRVAPLDLINGDVDPDTEALWLKVTPMKGGLVEFPVGNLQASYQYVLRAADHWKPLVNGISGFFPPVIEELVKLAKARPIPSELMTALERVPTSYVSVHETWLDPRERTALHEFLVRQTKTEPSAKAGDSVPWLSDEQGQPVDFEGRPEDASLIGGLDTPHEGSSVHGELLARGWARLVGEDLAVTLLLDGVPRRPRSMTRVPRPDVAHVLPQLGDCSTAGYEARFAFEPGDEGPHEMRAVFQAKDGRVRHYPLRRFTWLP